MYTVLCGPIITSVPSNSANGTVLRQTTMANTTKQTNKPAASKGTPAKAARKVPAGTISNKQAASPLPTVATAQPAAAPAASAAAKASKVLAALGAAAATATNTAGAAMLAVAPSIAAKGVANPAYPVTVAQCTYKLGAKLHGGACPARGVHDVAVVAKLHSVPALAQGKAVPSATLHTAGVPYHSLAAYVRRGWLLQAA